VRVFFKRIPVHDSVHSSIEYIPSCIYQTRSFKYQEQVQTQTIPYAHVASTEHGKTGPRYKILQIILDKLEKLVGGKL
jgi:hypothetical protein